MTKEEVLKIAETFKSQRVTEPGLPDGEMELILAFLRGEVGTVAASKTLQVIHKRPNVTLYSRMVRVVLQAIKEGRIVIKD